MIISNECDLPRLGQYLEDELPHDAVVMLFKHLDECSACREQLARLADPHHDASDIRQALIAEKSGRRSFTSWPRIEAMEGKLAKIDGFAAIKSLLAPSDDPLYAGRIEQFEIFGVIGRGGTGIVLKAREVSLDRIVAIKILDPLLASSPEAQSRFAREARAIASVLHENIVEIYRVSDWRGFPYFVMPYLPEQTLQHRLDRHGRMTLEDSLAIALQVARGLAAAHAQGLVHRDIKPANILLANGTERAIITDFGLARVVDDPALTRGNWIAGTPHYMSPEQARGQAVNLKSDIYSLGTLIQTMIAGKPPYFEQSSDEVIKAIAETSIPGLDESHPEWLRTLVSLTHAQNHTHRPEASHLANLLEQCLVHVRSKGKEAVPKELRKTAGPSIRSTLFAITLVYALLLGTWQVASYVVQQVSKQSYFIAGTAPSGPADSEIPLASKPNAPQDVTVEELEDAILESRSRLDGLIFRLKTTRHSKITPEKLEQIVRLRNFVEGENLICPEATDFQEELMIRWDEKNVSPMLTRWICAFDKPDQDGSIFRERRMLVDDGERCFSRFRGAEQDFALKSGLAKAEQHLVAQSRTLRRFNLGLNSDEVNFFLMGLTMDARHMTVLDDSDGKNSLLLRERMELRIVGTKQRVGQACLSLEANIGDYSLRLECLPSRPYMIVFAEIPHGKGGGRRYEVTRVGSFEGHPYPAAGTFETFEPSLPAGLFTPTKYPCRFSFVVEEVARMGSAEIRDWWPKLSEGSHHIDSINDTYTKTPFSDASHAIVAKAAVEQRFGLSTKWLMSGLLLFVAITAVWWWRTIKFSPVVSSKLGEEPS